MGCIYKFTTNFSRNSFSKLIPDGKDSSANATGRLINSSFYSTFLQLVCCIQACYTGTNYDNIFVIRFPAG